MNEESNSADCSSGAFCEGSSVHAWTTVRRTGASNAAIVRILFLYLADSLLVRYDFPVLTPPRKSLPCPTATMSMLKRSSGDSTLISGNKTNPVIAVLMEHGLVAAASSVSAGRGPAWRCRRSSASWLQFVEESGPHRRGRDLATEHSAIYGRKTSDISREARHGSQA